MLVARDYRADTSIPFNHRKLIVLYKIVCDSSEHESGLCAGLIYHLASSCQDLITPTNFILRMASEVDESFEVREVSLLLAEEIKQLSKLQTSLSLEPFSWSGLKPEFTEPFINTVKVASLDATSEEKFINELKKPFIAQVSTSLGIGYIVDVIRRTGHVVLCGAYADAMLKKTTYYYFDPNEGLMTWSSRECFLDFVTNLGSKLYRAQESLRKKHIKDLASEGRLLFASAFTCKPTSYTMVPLEREQKAMLTQTDFFKPVENVEYLADKFATLNLS